MFWVTQILKKRKRKPTRLELLNQACDSLAKDTRENNDPVGPMHFEDEDLSIWIGNKKIYSFYVNEIRDLYLEKEASIVLKDKFQWSSQKFKKVTWNVNKRAMSMMHKTKQIWISKYITGFLPIGVNMERRDEWKLTHCPRCKVEFENRNHIMRCKETTSVSLFQDSLLEFQVWLKKMDTPAPLIEEIILNVTLWHASQPPQAHKDSILAQQIILGNWDHFMEGRLHGNIIDYMQDHYNATSSRRSGCIWASQMIVKIWDLFYFKAWKLRNEFVHNRTENTTISRKREDLQYQIQSEYNATHKLSLLVKDQHLMETSAADIQKYSDDAMQSWLDELKLAKRDRDETYQPPRPDTPTHLRTWLQTKKRQDEPPTPETYSSQIPLDNRTWCKRGTKTTLMQGSWKPP